MAKGSTVKGHRCALSQTSIMEPLAHAFCALHEKPPEPVSGGDQQPTVQDEALIDDPALRS